MAKAKKRTTVKTIAKKSGGGATRKKSGGAKTATRSKASAGKSSASKARGTGRRELIDTGTDKRFVRRDGQGQFKESDDVGRSLSADRRRKAKTKAKPGQGDRGDRQSK